MRITDGFLALPAPVLAIAVVAALGPGFVHTLLAVSIVWWPFYARHRARRGAHAGRPSARRGRPARRGEPRSDRAHATCCPAPSPPRWSPPASTSAPWSSPWPALSFLGLGQSAPAPELGADAARNLQLPAAAVVDPGDARARRAAAGPRRQHRRRRHPQPHGRAAERSCRARPSSPSGSPRWSCVILLALTGVVFTAAADLAARTRSRRSSAPGLARRWSTASAHALGLDDPLLRAVLAATSTGLPHGDLGTSLPHPPRGDAPTSATFLPATLELALFGLALALRARPSLLGLQRRRCGGPARGVLRCVLLAGASAPVFLLGIVGILIVFYQQLGWLPANGRTDLVDVADRADRAAHRRRPAARPLRRLLATPSST